jgi:hypothetical protein
LWKQEGKFKNDKTQVAKSLGILAGLRPKKRAEMKRIMKIWKEFEIFILQQVLILPLSLNQNVCTKDDNCQCALLNHALRTLTRHQGT